MTDPARRRTPGAGGAVFPDEHPVQAHRDAPGVRHPLGGGGGLHRLSIRPQLAASRGFDRLTEIRESKSRQLEDATSDLTNSIVVDTDGSFAVEAIEAFTAAFDQLADARIDPACQQSIVDYYNNQLIKPTARITDALPVKSQDEFGYLTATFNEISRNLGIKDELLNEELKKNDHLPGSLMPESVIRRYREGEQTISQEHHDVTVMSARCCRGRPARCGTDRPTPRPRRFRWAPTSIAPTFR